MRIIDLLNKIANGEEVPNKIKYAGIIWEYDNTTEDYISDDMFLIHKMNSFSLNKSFEILEEEKKIPEKLNLDTDKLRGKETPRAIDYLIESKINEVIDCLYYLKSKGE